VIDAEAARLLADLGWDGAMRGSPGDYLLVVDTNMGFNKADALVKKRIDYAVDLTDFAQPHATLTLHYEHPLGQTSKPCLHRPRYDATYQEMMERCYWDYVRVYAPLGIDLLVAAPHAVPGEEMLSGRRSPAKVALGPTELGHDVLGTFFLLRPGETLETQFEYVLPAGVLRVEGKRLEYTLVAQKQAGTLRVPLGVTLKLPPGTQVSSEPAGTWVGDAMWHVDLHLETDQTVRVTAQLGNP
jgi:hypothetical protein